MLEFCQWLDQTAVGSAIRQSLWLFPAIETVHLLGMAALVGTISVLDLRLLGWAMPQRRVSTMAARLLPLGMAWLWRAGRHRRAAVLVRSRQDLRQPRVSIENAPAAIGGNPGPDLSDGRFPQTPSLGRPASRCPPWRKSWELPQSCCGWGLLPPDGSSGLCSSTLHASCLPKYAR